MNVIWSQYVQGTKTSYYSRKLRFDDMFAEQYKALFAEHFTAEEDEEMKRLVNAIYDTRIDQYDRGEK